MRKCGVWQGAIGCGRQDNLLTRVPAGVSPVRWLSRGCMGVCVQVTQIVEMPENDNMQLADASRYSTASPYPAFEMLLLLRTMQLIKKTLFMGLMEDLELSCGGLAHR